MRPAFMYRLRTAKWNSSCSHFPLMFSFIQMFLILFFLCFFHYFYFFFFTVSPFRMHACIPNTWKLERKKKMFMNTFWRIFTSSYCSGITARRREGETLETLATYVWVDFNTGFFLAFFLLCVCILLLKARRIVEDKEGKWKKAKYSQIKCLNW